MAIAVAEFKRRVAENSKELVRQLETGCWDLKKFHGEDAVAGEVSRSVLNRKADDIYAAVYLGALVFFNPIHGADAIMLVDGKLKEVELKTCSTTINKNRTFKTPGGAIYVTSPVHMTGNPIPYNKVQALTSAFAASFDKTSRARAVSKKYDTYLVMFDTVTDHVIDCYVLDGNTVSQMLSGTFRKGKFGVSGNTGCSDIKFGSFKKYGSRVSKLAAKPIGFDSWVESLLGSAVGLPVIECYR